MDMATLQMGMVWSLTVPGRVRIVLNYPSPPSNAFFTPDTA